MSLNSVALPLVNLQKRATDIPGFRKEKGITEDQAKSTKMRRYLKICIDQDHLTFMHWILQVYPLSGKKHLKIGLTL